MILVLSLAFGTIILFFGLARVFALEGHRGRRVFLAGVRNHLDTGIESIATSISRRVTYVSRYIITLSWYYSLHAFLKVVLQFLASIYYVVEKILHRNRDRARKIRIERKYAESHLSQIADHKVKTALTPSQKAKLKEKALRGE